MLLVRPRITFRVIDPEEGMISRQKAREIAEKVLSDEQLGNKVQSVLKADETTWAQPNLYDVNIQGCWIAYIQPHRVTGIESSQIVVIRQDTGKVIYFGSTKDEG